MLDKLNDIQNSIYDIYNFLINDLLGIFPSLISNALLIILAIGIIAFIYHIIF